MIMPNLRYRKELKKLFVLKYTNKNNLLTKKIRRSLKNAS